MSILSLTVPEIDFIRESNWIEGEYGDEAFQDAVLAWNFFKEQETPLTMEDILTVHSMLMGRLNPRIAGKLRTVNVRVGSQICPPWDTVPRLLTGWFMNQAHEVTTEAAITRAHVAFEHIHPFEDGNGRVGRMILNWQRLKCGLPILVIKESERQEYYKLFK